MIRRLSLITLLSSLREASALFEPAVVHHALPQAHRSLVPAEMRTLPRAPPAAFLNGHLGTAPAISFVDDKKEVANIKTERDKPVMKSRTKLPYDIDAFDAPKKPPKRREEPSAVSSDPLGASPFVTYVDDKKEVANIRTERDKPVMKSRTKLPYEIDSFDAPKKPPTRRAEQRALSSDPLGASPFVTYVDDKKEVANIKTERDKPVMKSRTKLPYDTDSFDAPKKPPKRRDEPSSFSSDSALPFVTYVDDKKEVANIRTERDKPVMKSRTKLPYDTDSFDAPKSSPKRREEPREPLGESSDAWPSVTYVDSQISSSSETSKQFTVLRAAEIAPDVRVSTPTVMLIGGAVVAFVVLASWGGFRRGTSHAAMHKHEASDFVLLAA